VEATSKEWGRGSDYRKGGGRAQRRSDENVEQYSVLLCTYPAGSPQAAVTVCDVYV
jgi:hypothetical protein